MYIKIQHRFNLSTCYSTTLSNHTGFTTENTKDHESSLKKSRCRGIRDRTCFTKRMKVVTKTCSNIRINISDYPEIAGIRGRLTSSMNYSQLACKNILLIDIHAKVAAAGAAYITSSGSHPHPSPPTTT